MKTTLTTYNKISNMFGYKKLLIWVAGISVILSAITLIFQSFNDAMIFISIGFSAFAMVMISIIKLNYIIRFKAFAGFPFKSDDLIKGFFVTIDLVIILFFSVIIISNVIAGNVAFACIQLFIFFVILNLCYFVTDGNDPRNQEFKISLFVFVMIFYGIGGGLFAATLSFLIESKDNQTVINSVIALTALISILTYFNRKRAYKKFWNNIMEMQKIKKLRKTA